MMSKLWSLGNSNVSFWTYGRNIELVSWVINQTNKTGGAPRCGRQRNESVTRGYHGYLNFWHSRRQFIGSWDVDPQDSVVFLMKKLPHSNAITWTF